jgi:hypothetical protein
MNLLTKEEIKRLVFQTEGFEIQQETERGIEVYDTEEDRFLNYKYLEEIRLEEMFQFNSLKVDKEKFFRVFRDCVDLNMLMIIDKVVFISKEEELEELLDEFPSQSMDIKENVGIHFYMDNVVVVNAKLIHELVNQDVQSCDYYVDFLEEFNRGIWETLIHELRHSITSNPIIPEEYIPLEEGSEEKVEEYCRRVFEEKVEKHPDYLCFG